MPKFQFTTCINFTVIPLIATILAACSSGSTTVNTTIVQCNLPIFTPQIGQELLDSWAAGLQKYSANNNPDIYSSAGYFTMSYYTNDATLLPTVSSQQRDGTQQIYNYFIGFLAKNPVMSLPKSESTTFTPLGCGYGAADGYYDFILNPDTTNETHIVNARFTFVYGYESQPFNEQAVVESGPSMGQTITQTNKPGWYIFIQQSSVLPPYESDKINY
jgi:hypothetical protein